MTATRKDLCANLARAGLAEDEAAYADALLAVWAHMGRTVEAGDRAAILAEFRDRRRHLQPGRYLRSV
jgi:hypothetical protein